MIIRILLSILFGTIPMMGGSAHAENAENTEMTPDEIADFCERVIKHEVEVKEFFRKLMTIQAIALGSDIADRRRIRDSLKTVLFEIGQTFENSAYVNLENVVARLSRQ